MRRYFGTDGVRGRVGEAPITPEFVLKLGWAAGRVLAGRGSGKVIIGKDTRISGYMFESALQAGLSAAGINIRLLGPMPTPAVAYLTHTLHCDAGIVISASHNPYYDNGIKFFSAQGTKLPDEVERAIEAELDKDLAIVPSAELGKAERVADAGGRYIEFCKGTNRTAVRLDGLKVVVDCANGATYHVAPKAFAELGASVTTIGTEPDGLNINAGCGSTQPGALQAAVRDQDADLGIALDGDGDRVIMVDHTGAVVDGDELLYMIAADRHASSGLEGGVVGTLMSNLGLEHALAAMGIPFQRAPVGDRYVMDVLAREHWQLGGESSGHIICLDRTSTGDGIVAAVQVLAALARSGRTLKELRAGMTKYPQSLVNVRLAGRVDLSDNPQVQSALREAEASLGGSGRVLLRASGTEPLMRVMVEGADAAQVHQLAEEIAGVVRAAAGP